MSSRRNFLTGLTSTLIAAPAIVSFDNIMPVKQMLSNLTQWWPTQTHWWVVGVLQDVTYHSSPPLSVFQQLICYETVNSYADPLAYKAVHLIEKISDIGLQAGDTLHIHGADMTAEDVRATISQPVLVHMTECTVRYPDTPEWKNRSFWTGKGVTFKATTETIPADLAPPDLSKTITLT